MKTKLLRLLVVMMISITSIFCAGDDDKCGNDCL